MLYPVLCVPVYKEMVWGGSRMKSVYGRSIPSDKTGESWDIVCRTVDNTFSVIENGADAGKTLAEWFAADRAGTLGTRNAEKSVFPLLIKIIDAQDDLSVQVHPDDDYARAFGELGKNEMWYILEPPESGSLIIGLKEGVTREELRRACETGTGVEQCLNRLPVKRGDMVNLPAGMVHALTRGAMIAEIQQSSDVTFRLYDYGRLGLDGKPRPLHIEHSINTADFDNALPKEVVKGNSVINEYYSVTKLEIDGTIREATDRGTFTLLTCVGGDCAVKTADGGTEIPLSRTAFIPAGLGEYALTGKGTALKSFVP